MRRTLVRSAALFGILGALYAGCTNDFDQFTTRSTESAASTSTSTSTASTGAGDQGGVGGGSGAGGQGGGAPMCTDDSGCDDKNPCTADTCDKAAGMCQHENDDAAAPPDDSNPCTDDSCSD